MSNILFDARQHTPQQGSAGAHPIGIYDAQISNTYAAKCGPNAKDPNGTMFVAEFTTPGGKIEKRYNVQNNSEQAVAIAQKEMSALCYAVGIFTISAPTLPDGSLNMPEVGKELRGSRLKIDVGFQIDKETKQNSAYTEVKRVLDVQGNEPGKPATAAPQPQQAPAANGGAASGGWATGQGGATNNAPPGGAWAPGPNQPQGQTAQQANPGWTQGQTSPNPPWGGNR